MLRKVHPRYFGCGVMDRRSGAAATTAFLPLYTQRGTNVDGFDLINHQEAWPFFPRSLARASH